MATQTTYYEFNKPAGTDLVNPLVDTNPNWDKADAGLHELDERSIANATETVALGVHAISRLNTYTKFIKWIATANFTAGETFTVDGNVVAASTPSGAALETGAYVSGAVIFACLNADDTAITIFVSGTTVASDSQRLGGELPAYYATAAAMESAELDIDNIQALNGNTSIASIGDGTLTGAVSAMNNELSNINDKLDMKDILLDKQNAISAIPFVFPAGKSISDYNKFEIYGYVSNTFIHLGTVVNSPDHYNIGYVAPGNPSAGISADITVTNSGATIQLFAYGGFAGATVTTVYGTI